MRNPEFPKNPELFHPWKRPVNKLFPVEFSTESQDDKVREEIDGVREEIDEFREEIDGVRKDFDEVQEEDVGGREEVDGDKDNVCTRSRRKAAIIGELRRKFETWIYWGTIFEGGGESVLFCYIYARE